jgi:ribonuclease BN (tRNA processing enzyme)
MSSTLPQRSYFNQEYSIPGLPWKLSGHSRALERTGFLFTGGGIRILLDAGIDIPDFSPPDLILLTHSHIDHCNALPMLYRLTSAKSLVHIFTPALVINKLRQFVAMSFSIKVDDGSPIPEHYQPPIEYNAAVAYSSPIFSPWEENTHRWHPVIPGLIVPLCLGKNGKKEIEVRTVKLYHTISTVGYIVSEKKSKLRPDLSHLTDKKLTQQRVMEARARGETVTVEFYQPLVAYLCDTTARVLYNSSQGAGAYPVEPIDYPHATMNNNNSSSGRSGGGEGGCCHSSEETQGLKEGNAPAEAGEYDEEETLRLIFSCPIVMIECTYLEESFAQEAERRGHVVWSFLQPILLQYFTSLSSFSPPHGHSHSSFVLMHFSLRYSDEDIIAFFMDPNRCLLPNPSQSPHRPPFPLSPPLDGPLPQDSNSGSCSSKGDGDKDSDCPLPPPHLILWLDTGIVKLWYQFN